MSSIAKPRKRTKGANLSNDAVNTLFTDHIPLASCAAKSLFKLSKISKAGVSCEYDAFKKTQPLMDAVLDISGGAKQDFIQSRKISDVYSGSVRALCLLHC